ncbi:hypothetical protein ACFQO4_20820 [Saliphagus sp. GCM10025334]
MKLAHGEYDLPSIDWLCKECGEVYVSAGYPPETRCTDGHAAGWKPRDDVFEEYIATLESLEPGDWLAIVGEGPAPLKGPVESVGDGELTTKELNAPARYIRWECGDDDTDPSIVWDTDDEYATFTDDVHHAEAIEAESVTRTVRDTVRAEIDDILDEAAHEAGLDLDEAEVSTVRMADGELEITFKREVPA